MQRKHELKKADDAQRNTRERILRVAMKTFAKYGYKEATTRRICAEARVNIALVNYYFRSKADLYRAVIATLFENIGKPMLAIPDAVEDEATWREAFRTWISRALAICAADKPPESYAARLMGMEECSPSDMAQDIDRNFGEPVRRGFERLFRMALPDATREEIGLWSGSVSAQVVIYALTQSRWASKFCALTPGADRQVWLERVTDHICEGIFCRLSFQRKI